MILAGDLVVRGVDARHQHRGVPALVEEVVYAGWVRRHQHVLLRVIRRLMELHGDHGCLCWYVLELGLVRVDGAG